MDDENSFLNSLDGVNTFVDDENGSLTKPRPFPAQNEPLQNPLPRTQLQLQAAVKHEKTTSATTSRGSTSLVLQKRCSLGKRARRTAKAMKMNPYVLEKSMAPDKQNRPRMKTEMPTTPMDYEPSRRTIVTTTLSVDSPQSFSQLLQSAIARGEAKKFDDKLTSSALRRHGDCIPLACASSGLINEKKALASGWVPVGSRVGSCRVKGGFL